MGKTILLAFALVLVIEGIMPFSSPETWRKVMAMMSQQSDKTMRIIGLVSMLIGVLITFIIHFNW